MSALVVSPVLLKAAKLFASGNKGGPLGSSQPWAWRVRRTNVLVAFDGPTLFACSDREGMGYPHEAVQVGDPSAAEAMPSWVKNVTRVQARRRAMLPITLDPRFHARVLRAARMLELKSVSMSVGGAMEVIAYTLGPDAFALVMPQFDLEKPTVPEWLRAVTG